VRGTFNSTASTNFRIEFFGNTEADTSGHGEGRTYLGFVNVTTNASGNTSFNVTLATAASAVVVSATATRANANFTTFSDTSEFSANQAILEGRPRNTVPGPQTVPEDTSQAIGGLSLISPGATTVSVTLSVTNGRLTVSLSGGATLSGGANGSGTLTLSGTLAQANAALATLLYQGGANYNGSATLTMLSGDGTSTDSDTVPITVTPVNDAPVLVGGTSILPNVSEDNSTPGGTSGSDLLGVRLSDVDAGAVQGIAIIGTTGSVGTWQYFNGSIWVAIGARSASNALLLDASDLVRFRPDGTNGGTATLTYLGWDQTSGTRYGSADASVTGGSTAFSVQSAGASVTILSANDAPVLTPIAPTLTGITEDETNPAGQTVASFLGSSVTDVDTGAVQGIAITAVTGAIGQWQYSLDGGGSWTAVGAGDASNSLLLRATDRLRFVPDGSNGATATVTYRAWDQSSGSAGAKASTTSSGGQAAFSTALDTAALTVSAVNDAPVLSGTTTAIASVSEGNADPGGTLVSTLLGSRLTDVDNGAQQGIAITGTTGSVGRWQFYTGGAWADVGSVSGASALLLRSSDYVRFLPDDTNGGTASLTYHGWDRTSGSAGTKADATATGGTSAFSTATNTASVTIVAANDAPVLTPAGPNQTGITEDQTNPAGQTVASFVGGSITDIDSGAVQGIAIHAASATHGQWEYSLDGGTNWGAVGTVDASGALLLRTGDLVRFVPNGQNGTTASIGYRAWDQSAGAAGDKANTNTNGGSSAFSAATDTATLAVASLNDAPTLVTASPTLNPLTEKQTTNSGQTVDSFTGAAIGDVDSGAVKGIAINATVNGSGIWQYSLDDGASWSAMGSVGSTSALLLRATDRVRFVPDGVNGTTGSIGYRAWDQSSGAAGSKVNPGAGGGTSAFSSNANTASITVTNVNDAPVLAPAAPVLTALTEDDVANTGQTVASIVGATISDADPGALQGIAIAGSTNGNGQWQYSVDGGSNWLALGSASDASARLLRDTDRVRFVPDGVQGTSATLSYRAWDRSSGTAGGTGNASSNGASTAFSSTANTASIAVSNINDAPAFSGLGAVSHTEGGAPSVLGASATVTDPELAAANDYAGATLTLSRNGGASAQDIFSATGLLGTLTQGGNLVYDGTTVGTVTQNSAGTLVLSFNASATQARVNGVLQVIAYANASDAPPASVQLAWSLSDGNAGAQGPGGALAGSGSTTVTITATNDAPVLAPFAPTLASLVADQTNSAGQTVASIVGSSISDPDGTGLPYGIAITSTGSGNGTWQYNTGGGWTNVGAVSGASSLLLRSGDLVRFVPNGQDATVAIFQYRAWDQSSGSAGAKVATTANGGSSAFSTASDTAGISVTAANYAPVLTPMAPALNAIDEDAVNNAGQTVASFLGSSVSDANGLGAQRGIAITSQSAGNGSLQYSLDGGTNWTALGTVDAAGSLLLRDTDRVRFVPNGAAGTSATLSYRAWDQTSGTAGAKVSTATTGGLTAFSNASDTATITVTEVNDAPVLTPINTVLPAITEDLVLQRQVFTQVGLDSISDVDGGALKGMAIIGLDPGNGTVEYSTDGVTGSRSLARALATPCCCAPATSCALSATDATAPPAC
jgi:hypothetical protein